VADVGKTSTRDLSQGVIVVLSGGAFDFLNPVEVRNRMDQLILDVNADPYVLANSGGQGLTFKLLPDQQLNHLHQSKWPQICDRLQLLTASPLILIGHSNGGAAVIDIARCLQKKGKVVDLAITADSVLTLNDNGGTNKVPSNITINLNPYVIPTASWWELPFPFGQPNQRETGNPLDGILNIGLPFDEPGAIAHRDAFYDLAGGDKSVSGDYTYPEMMRDTVLSVLRGATSDQLFQLAQTDLQTLANEARVSIDLDTTNYSTKLVPAGLTAAVSTRRVPQPRVEDLRKLMTDLEKQRLSAFHGA
jgi:hypothetical protein